MRQDPQRDDLMAVVLLSSYNAVNIHNSLDVNVANPRRNVSTTGTGKVIIPPQLGRYLSCLSLATMILTMPLQFQWSDNDLKLTSPRDGHFLHHQQPLPITVVRSNALALTEGQRLVMDVWNEVTRQYVDTSYNGMGLDGWKSKRLDAVTSITNVDPDDKEKIYNSIRKMLQSLGDPYTRFLTPEQYESLTALAKGGSAGIGVQLLTDPRSGHVIVVSTASKGPAAQAGLQAGDWIVEVDGRNMDGQTPDVVAAKMRGEPGTFVNLVTQHPDQTSVNYVTIQRQNLKVNPVEISTHFSDNGRKIGIFRISSFNQETPSQVLAGLREVQGMSALVLDIRGNAGGYMPAGVDVAKLFLNPQERIISEVDKAGRKTIYIAEGVGSETSIPMFVLVDRGTASASEILTAALVDNGRATVVGTSQTFGKGRIQNVQPLLDGSGVAVTRAIYVSPTGKQIDKNGIEPSIRLDRCRDIDPAQTCLSGLL